MKDIRFGDWLAKGQSSVIKIRCKICGISFNLSYVGVETLASHSSGKKHSQKIEESNKMSVYFKRNNRVNETSNSGDKISQKTVEEFVNSASALSEEIR